MPYPINIWLLILSVGVSNWFTLLRSCNFVVCEDCNSYVNRIKPSPAWREIPENEVNSRGLSKFRGRTRSFSSALPNPTIFNCRKSDHNSRSLSPRLLLPASYTRKTSSKVGPPKVALLSTISTAKATTPLKSVKKRLTPWEGWMNKKKAERTKAMQELAKLKEQDEAKKRLVEEHRLEEKRMKKTAVQKWLEKKDMEIIRQKEVAKIVRLERETEAAKKKEQQIRAQEDYQEWLKRKQQESQTERRRDEEKRRAHELAKEEKRRQAEASFRAWIRSLKTSVSAARANSPHTYYVSDGVLIKYFDRTSAPEPGFVNQNSWVS